MAGDPVSAFDGWWVAASPPGTFDRFRCRLAFIGGWRACESAREQRDEADPAPPELYTCPWCGTGLGIKE